MAKLLVVVGELETCVAVLLKLAEVGLGSAAIVAGSVVKDSISEALCSDAIVGIVVSELGKASDTI